MTPIKITSIAFLSLLLGIAVPVYAQHEQQDEKQDHPGQQQHAQKQQKQSDENKQQQHHQQQRSDQNKQQQHAQQQRSDQNKQHAQQQQHAQPQQHAQHRERPQPSQQQQHVEQAAWQEHRARSWQSDHRNWQQRGGYNGYHIPDNRYRGYLGPDHAFHIYGLPFLVVGGYPRFQYQGYWFSAVDPWPEYWANDWYDTDVVYVTYVDNGYYMFNRRYPNVGIAIRISM